MKYHEKTLAAVLATCVLLSACSSSGSDAVTLEDTPTIENVTTGSTAEPTTSSGEPGGTLQLDEINDDDLIAAALAVYQAAPQPEGTIAWDMLNTSVFENQVSFTMCTWDGLTANDATRDVKYITTITDGGTIEASNVQSSPTSAPGNFQQRPTTTSNSNSANVTEATAPSSRARGNHTPPAPPSR